MKGGFGIRAALILIGVTAAIAQIVLLRELMVVFHGNEISIGLMLASWLFWTAVGSSINRSLRPAKAAGTPAARYAVAARYEMAGIQTLVAAALPLTILAVRASKGLLQTAPGELLGPGPVLLTSLGALGPLCMLTGALFTAGSKVVGDDRPQKTMACPTGSVYLWEAVGWAGGGLAAGLWLAPYLSSMEIAFLVAALNLMAACGLTIARRPLRYAAMAAIAAAALWKGWPQRIETASQAWLWRGQRLVAARNSAYGSLAVVGTETSRSLYENGVALFTAPDPAAAEDAVHYALLEHPAPRSLLLIVGGVNGSVEQALRHPTLERVDYVELDPAILDLAREYFPTEWTALQADGRVHVHVTDGRLFVKSTASTFDVMVVNLPEPRTAQLNRFYTVEFFREAARKLTAGGLLSFQLPASEDYISAERGEYLRSIYGSLREAFPEVTYIPGETVHFFAARRAGTLAPGADELLARLRARNLRTSYVSEYFLPFRMAPDRMADLDAQLRSAAPTPINRDFAPVAYYFDVALWSSQFSQGYRRFFQAMAGVGFGTVAVALGAALLTLAAAGRGRARFVAGFATASMGFTSIALEMLVLLAFQAVYGSVYRQLAVVIAAFMAGMALGTWLGMRGRGGIRVLAATQALAAAAPLVLVGLFHAVSPMAFPALAAVCGMLGGYEFSVASGIFSRGKVSSLYALDLAGSCVGAVFLSAWFVPVFGFIRTALLLTMVSLAPAGAALVGSDRPRKTMACPTHPTLRIPGR